ncbi:MAG TPA: hypothetical protein VEC35_18270 [Noviherbaspirillum sp.]|nr:hypothetical protein [Noviherbaspirillum sp.]
MRFRPDEEPAVQKLPFDDMKRGRVLVHLDKESYCEKEKHGCVFVDAQCTQGRIVRRVGCLPHDAVGLRRRRRRFAADSLGNTDAYPDANPDTDADANPNPNPNPDANPDA